MLLASVLATGCAAPPGTQAVEETRLLMGTTFRIRVVAPDPVAGRAAVAAALDEVARVEALLSEWRDDSEISEVNRQAGGEPVVVGPEMLEVVQRGIEIARRTDGAFDMTFAACGGLWSMREERIPTDDALADCLELVDWAGAAESED